LRLSNSGYRFPLLAERCDYKSLLSELLEGCALIRRINCPLAYLTLRRSGDIGKSRHTFHPR